MSTTLKATRTSPVWRQRLAGLVLVFAAVAFAGCTEPEPESQVDGDDLAFPWDGEAQGKTDTFGRSLVGAPDPYIPDPDLIANPNAADDELATNMKRRREVAWNTTFKVLEPVPLLALANQLDALPSCPDGVVARELDRCVRETDRDACHAFSSGGHSDICGWDDATSSCSPVCDNLAADGVEIPKIPRFQTWYGVEDITAIFKHAYNALSPEDQVARVAFSDSQIGAAFVADHTAIERSSRWPLWRYTSKVDQLFDCDLTQGADETDDAFGERCALARQSQFSGAAAAGGGIARLVYSPAMVLHMMRNYGEILECEDQNLSDTWCADGEPCQDPPDNFSTCFRSEFPADAGNPWAALSPFDTSGAAGLPAPGGTVVIKATWSRVGFGFELPAWDTDADSLLAKLGPGTDANWDNTADRQYAPESSEDPGFPTRDDIYTIQTKSGGTYRLTGLHIMTKELRHWQWITLWWSDTPDSDFGEDRPDSFNDLPGVWSNYKMCVVVDYLERDPDAAGRFADFPSLQAALLATDSSEGAPTWCSNPYIEHEAGNARTNCIGCHQHAGTRMDEAGDRTFDLAQVIATEGTTGTSFPANGRVRRRNHFASDYSWAFSRLDDLTSLVRNEVDFKGSQDDRWVRINGIVNGEGDVTAGEEVFRNADPDETCTTCHGINGEGGFGPNFEQVFSQRTDWEIMHTIIDGRGSMPTWGSKLSDQQLTDLLAFLRTSFSER